MSNMIPKELLDYADRYKLIRAQLSLAVMNACRAARLALLVKMSSARHPWPSRFEQHWG
jgi:hypothetical protein